SPELHHRGDAGSGGVRDVLDNQDEYQQEERSVQRGNRSPRNREQREVRRRERDTRYEVGKERNLTEHRRQPRMRQTDDEVADEQSDDAAHDRGDADDTQGVPNGRHHLGATQEALW